ncbi:rhomboid family intramembrane serine protease [Texcoconibacillus texcoconensis]|uniref:Rhomboid protease GluP n=1 Tax=Texcoconibacillus texcoconensis TaxID=1095777 RepID=A0A840QP01_9BACI|nr:rhomboid family intramembrane serine protease [Texcoconibacillus texcoconensis]MBB5173126.1 rhomboid protease GluP [Texcoconibacillus texcoconensis]
MPMLDIHLKFWDLAYRLVIREGMRVVQFNNHADELWLEDDRCQRPKLIRLHRKDLDWRNELKKSIDNTKERAKKIKKSNGLHQANVYHIIVSAYSPVDEWESLVQTPLPLTVSSKKQEMKTIVLTDENIQETLYPLATEWELNEVPSLVNPYYVDDPEQYIQMFRRHIKQTMKQRIQQERNIFLYGRPVFTFGLLGVIFLMYMLTELEGGSTSVKTLIDFGAKFNPLIQEGEWWRFISAMFLHIGFFHLFMNSLALFYLGGAVERIFGTSRFVFIYFIAGLTGSIASFVFNENISAGASGAIFGCFGALLYFGLRHKRLFFRTMGMNVIVILAINLGLGFVVPMIDNGAHIGGLIGGFVASAMIALPKNSHVKSQIGAWVLAPLALSILTAIGFLQEQGEEAYLPYVQVGQEQAMEEDFQSARESVRKALANGVDEPEAYFVLANTEAALEEYHDAKEHFQTVVNKDPSFHEAYYNLTLVYVELGQFNEAESSIERALEIDSDNRQYRLLLEEIQQHQ